MYGEQDFHGGNDYGAVVPNIEGDKIYPIVENSEGIDRNSVV